jgi:phosphoglycerate dehydrogenase-like enzyme
MKRIAIIDDWGGMVSGLPIWQRLEGRARIDAFGDTLASEDALAERLAPYEIVVPTRERTFFRAGLLGRLPALRMIAIGGRWTGQVDLAAAAAKAIVVTDTEGSGVNAFEHTVALMMALVRRVPQEDRATREGRWQTPPIGVDMDGKTLGIIGLGRIGGKMAAFGRLLGMRVLATGITLTDQRAAAAGATRVDLDTLLRESDVVSVHYRLSDKTRGLITARHLALMKPGAFLVNTARGPIVDERALVEALRARRIAGAALDVFDVEPLPKGHPLLALDNVVLTPHLGFVTAEGYGIFFGQATESILAYLDGKTPPRVVTARG